MPEFRSKLHKAFRGTDSLRTTVPASVAAMLGLTSSDEIAWVVEPGKLVAEVSRAGGTPKKRTSKSR